MAESIPLKQDGTGTVIVVHGLGRTPASMAILVSRLKKAGFHVVSFRYPSTSEPMEALVERLQTEVTRCCESEVETVHFVTHSMGGVLVRIYLNQRPHAHRGRVVMLSPPNQGSEIVDAFAASPLLSRLIPGPDDGKVGVDRAKVEGAADFMGVSATHTFIMNRRDVSDEVVYFLRHGQFRRRNSEIVRSRITDPLD